MYNNNRCIFSYFIDTGSQITCIISNFLPFFTIYKISVSPNGHYEIILCKAYSMSIGDSCAGCRSPNGRTVSDIYCIGKVSHHCGAFCVRLSGVCAWTLSDIRRICMAFDLEIEEKKIYFLLNNFSSLNIRFFGCNS